jgi:hypothetical protein
VLEAPGPEEKRPPQRGCIGRPRIFGRASVAFLLLVVAHCAGLARAFDQFPLLRGLRTKCGGKYFLTCANALGVHWSSKAIDRKTGARGLRFESMLLDTMFDLPSLEGVEEVMILSARYFSPSHSLRLLDVILSHPRILI